MDGLPGITGYPSCGKKAKKSIESMKYVENTGRKTTTVDKEHSPITKKVRKGF
jgi:hypothetical protein